MTYSDDFLEQLREACPMETIAGNYVNLIRRGRHYVCNHFILKNRRLVPYSRIHKVSTALAAAQAAM